MRLVIAVVTFVLAVNALSEKSHWESFKVKYEKSYLNAAEENYRYSIFLNNLKKINDHNEKYEAGLSLYKKGVNQFTDLTSAEFRQVLGHQKLNQPDIQVEQHEFSGLSTVPDSFDWRGTGAVTEVKNQYFCGSCWAFSTVGVLEGQNFILNNVSISLSAQQLVDCSSDYGDNDCQEGGERIYGLGYVADHGIDSEQDYPYDGYQTDCRADETKTVFKVKGYKNLTHSEEALKEAVATIGPISVAIYADPIEHYYSGIFDDVECVSNTSLINHDVLVVGYGTENDTPFWIVKNSWGQYWGAEGGYIRIKRGLDLCAISAKALYPVV